ncbi:uracil-DNA glycosylase [Sandaracinobacter sp. RS1-74]|uniref:uracil-DNA glycosylase n=1 Tax=Sandaracinobacteroides sayramensis TaxID=2913411 RepID=UPI001EDAD13F|nr:uracil-DNA glycosylase [Sandaracinobacteroides sayramensis]
MNGQGESGQAKAGAVKLEESWRIPLAPVFEAPFMAELRRFLVQEREQGKIIMPRAANWFRAMDLTPLSRVRVVILGQDPYHGAGQAHGLSFSVPPGVAIPPSLRNIFKELKDDLDIPPASHGFLESWAKQGVLLLNSVLTVEQGRPASHAGKGWERFTDEVIKLVAARAEPAVFLLWGRYAQQKAGFVDSSRHLVLKAAHPSPFSADNGFFGCRHFSKANAFLAEHGLDSVDWRLPPLK